MTEENNDKSKNSRLEKWTQLTNAITLICNQDQTIWNIFGYFWGTNALLLIALFSTGKLPTDAYVGIIVSTLGAMLSLLWRFIQKRAIAHLKRFESIMLKMEELLNLDPPESLSGIRNVDDYELYIGKDSGAARKWIIRSTTIILCLWTMALIFFIVKSLQCYL